jgi:hypothetical protein
LSPNLLQLTSSFGKGGADVNMSYLSKRKQAIFIKLIFQDKTPKSNTYQAKFEITIGKTC